MRERQAVSVDAITSLRRMKNIEHRGAMTKKVRRNCSSISNPSMILVFLKPATINDHPIYVDKLQMQCDHIWAPFGAIPVLPRVAEKAAPVTRRFATRKK